MVLNISVKFGKNISNGFQVIDLTYLYDQNHNLPCSKGCSQKVGKLQLWFLCSACFLRVVNISVQFHENFSNSYQQGVDMVL